jgi:signal transduction histidine kinase
MMAFLSLVVALAGIYYTSQSNTKLVQLLEQDQKITSYVRVMERETERLNSSVRTYVTDAEAEKDIVTAIQNYEQANAELSQLVQTLDLPAGKYDAVKDIYADYSEQIQFILSIDVTNFPRAPTFLWERNGPKSGPVLADNLIQAIDDLLASYHTLNSNQINEARNNNLSVTIVALLLVTVAGILAAFVTSLITRSVTRPLRLLAGVARAIRKDDLDVEVPVIRGEDEVANLAGAMASMAQNLRLSRQRLENSLEETRRRNKELSAVNRVAATIGQSLDLEVVLHDALHQLMAVAEMEYGSIFLMEPDGQYLRLAAYHNQSEVFVRNYNRVSIDDQITGQVARTGEVMMVENPMDDPRVTNQALRTESFKKFYLGVPFKSKGKVLGVANLTSQQIRVWEQSDLDLLRAIGSQIAIAIDNARLYQQASELAAVDERNRLARDLHDSVTQTLFSITLTAESARAMYSRKPEKVEGQLDRLQNLARGALAEMRSLIFQLRPAALQEQGLVAALEKHIAALKAKETFEIELEVKGARRLSDEHEQTLYRIAQEAFNNITKHSQATHVWVTLEIDDQGATLTIKDNGIGFEADSVLERKDRVSLGLTSMQERTELAGGTYKIESTPGNGTCICVSLPLSFAPLPVGMGINK